MCLLASTIGKRMTFNPLISVIIPIYNGANYVSDAIESILSQTYSNFEIIIVDDGSTDDGATYEAVRPFLNRVKYYRKENGGVASALNTGILEMSGDYFAWLSHDDIFLPHKLESQISLLSEMKNRKILLYSDYSIMNAKKEHMYDVILDANMLKDSSNHMPVLRGCLNGCTMLIHKEIFEDCGKFDLTLRYTQDYELWGRICWKYPMIHQDNITVSQRIHENQDSNKSGSIPECDTLWINLIKERDETVRTEISGSSIDFLEGMQSFLSQTPYVGAQNFVANEIEKTNKMVGTLNSTSSEFSAELSTPLLNELEKAHTEPGLSIILNHEVGYERALVSIDALTFALENFPNSEIIFITSDHDDFGPLLKSLKQSSTQVHCLNSCDEDISLARKRAISETEYDYIMFLTTYDTVIRSSLSEQVHNMAQKKSVASYAPYLSVCEELSKDGIIVPSHWLGALTTDDIIARNAVNLSTMMFHKKVFTNKLQPPAKGVVNEIEFLLELRASVSIYEFREISIASNINYSMPPINLTHSLDSISALISKLELNEKFFHHKKAITSLYQRYEELYLIRIQNENSGKDISINTTVESIFKSNSNSDILIGKLGTFSVDLLKSE